MNFSGIQKQLTSYFSFRCSPKDSCCVWNANSIPKNTCQLPTGSASLQSSVWPSCRSRPGTRIAAWSGRSRTAQNWIQKTWKESPSRARRKKSTRRIPARAIRQTVSTWTKKLQSRRSKATPQAVPKSSPNLSKRVQSSFNLKFQQPASRKRRETKFTLSDTVT